MRRIGKLVTIQCGPTTVSKDEPQYVTGEIWEGWEEEDLQARRPAIESAKSFWEKKVSDKELRWEVL